MKKLKREQIRYKEKVDAIAPKSKTLSGCIRAFIAGGLICMLGQAIGDVGSLLFSFSETDRGSFTSIALIFIGALLTGVGVYDNIGAWAGAGSIVPITGFSNSIVSPAMEFKREGLVMGVGSKLFTVAGPVLVYGISVSILIGLLTCLFS